MMVFKNQMNNEHLGCKSKSRSWQIMQSALSSTSVVQVLAVQWGNQKNISSSEMFIGINLYKKVRFTTWCIMWTCSHTKHNSSMIEVEGWARARLYGVTCTFRISLYDPPPQARPLLIKKLPTPHYSSFKYIAMVVLYYLFLSLSHGNSGNPPQLLHKRHILKTQRVNFKPPPPPTSPIWKPPLYRERKALFRSDGVLQSAPVILQPTQTGQPATNTLRRRRISASDFRRATIRKGDLLRQSELGKLSAIGNRVRNL